MNAKWCNILKKPFNFRWNAYFFRYVFVLINDLWKGVLVKQHLKANSILARWHCCFWCPIIRLEFLELLVLRKSKFPIQSLIPNVKWLVLQAIYCFLVLFCFFLLTLCFLQNDVGRFHNPFGILGQMNCHLDSRGKEMWDENSQYYSLYLWKFSRMNIFTVYYNQNSRFKHMIWMGFWFITFVPGRKFDSVCGKPRWGRLGARFQFNIKFIQVFLALRDKPLCGFLF